MAINYPNKMNKDASKIITKVKRNDKKANLGSDFETKLNDSNIYYLNKGIAAIYKKPTPVQIVKVDYPSRNKARIVEAYYKILKQSVVIQQVFLLLTYSSIKLNIWLMLIV